MIHVVIVEDDTAIRSGLQMLLGNSPGFSCLAAFGNAEEALPGIAELRPDVAIVDIHLPGMTGTELVRKLKPQNPQIQFVMLTVFEDTDSIFGSLKAGATGYLVKSTPQAKILEAITEVHSGGSPMSGAIARKVISSFSEQSKVQQTSLDLLSKREQEILKLLSRGFRYKEIGEALFISTETVRTHIRNIYEKLQVESGIEAINKTFGKSL